MALRVARDADLGRQAAERLHRLEQRQPVQERTGLLRVAADHERPLDAGRAHRLEQRREVVAISNHARGNVRDGAKLDGLQLRRELDRCLEALRRRGRDGDGGAAGQERRLVAGVLQGDELERRIGEDPPERGPAGVVEPGTAPEDRHGPQTSESGKDAFRFAMNSWSASSMPGSIGGASYSLSIRFQILFARCEASRPPSSSHCS